MKRLLILTAALLLPLVAVAQDWKSLARYNRLEAKEKLTKRFTEYVTFDTQSDPNATAVPSTKGQKAFAKSLAKELKKLGAANVLVDEFSIVTAEIPATTTKNVPVIAFLAHMDTAAEVSGKNVKPQVFKNYQGGNLIVNADKKLVLNPLNSPQLATATGHDIITASGNTLLGADDKTGVAIIMTMADYLLNNPGIEHGLIKIAFTPDEEIGTGVEKLDVAKFGANYAYTVDGGDAGEMVTENFNAKGFVAVFEGDRGVHTGQAMYSNFSDNTMMSADFRTLLPRQSRPETTAGKKGFIYPDVITEQDNTSKVTGLIRAFSEEEMNQLVAATQQSFDTVKAMYPKAKNMTLAFKDQYKNMKSVTPENVISIAEMAMKEEEVKPNRTAARGGTDGATLAQAGLPTPDIFAGMYNFHSELEYADVDVMEASLRTLIRLSTLWGQQVVKAK